LKKSTSKTHSPGIIKTSVKREVKTFEYFTKVSNKLLHQTAQSN